MKKNTSQTAPTLPQMTDAAFNALSKTEQDIFVLKSLISVELQSATLSELRFVHSFLNN